MEDGKKSNGLDINLSKAHNLSKAQNLNEAQNLDEAQLNQTLEDLDWVLKCLERKSTDGSSVVELCERCSGKEFNGAASDGLGSVLEICAKARQHSGSTNNTAKAIES